MKIKAAFDGSRDHDGRLSAGGWIADDTGRIIWQAQADLNTKSRHPAEAEMRGCMILLDELSRRKELTGSDVTIQGDYKCLIDILNRKGRFSEPKLASVWLRLTEILGIVVNLRGMNIHFVHVPREENWLADRLSRVERLPSCLAQGYTG